ncbi:MAG: isoaspartyl peptidase/L-asparaginase [Nitrospirae bacterium]|nr:isoaspartyl peptidase/L-asparaginase [Nitrospirota bacterium]
MSHPRASSRNAIRVIIVQGGAGKRHPREAERQRVCKESCRIGLQCATPLDAVEAAVRVLEEHPLFNAGLGSVLQLDGKAREDAAIMLSDGRCGAVCAVPDILHPITLARKVMEETPHVLLAGEKALAWALSHGFEKSDLRTPERIRQWREWKADHRRQAAERSHGTVGAVALDAKGRLAAATSTGGIFPALPGRVGDTPVIGAGTYCSRVAAASATGEGEAIIRSTLTREAVRYVEEGMTPQQAASRAIQRLKRVGQGTGGIVVLDRKGRAGAAFNTGALTWAMEKR